MSRTRPDALREHPLGWEDPIVAEIHRIRQNIMAEANDDVAAFVARLQTRRDSDRQRGFREADLPHIAVLA
jgi:hypothetical protein